MNILKKYSAAFGLLVCTGTVFAQWQPGNADPAASAANAEAVNKNWMPSLVKDGAIDAVPHVNRAMDQSSIREVDVAWKRRVWRVIDIRQKQNQAFTFTGDEYSGGGAFIEILNDAIKKGKVQAYSGIDDRFTQPLSMESFDKMVGGSVDSTKVIDPETGEEVWKLIRNEFVVTSVTKFRIKEDWIFDRNLGRMVIRIVGIAPLKDQLDPNTGVYLYTTPMYWLNYDQLRKVLVNYEVYNPQNDVHRMTWTDYLDGRYFSSYVIKTSADNPTGADFERNSLRGLEQGERAVETLRDKEDNMWER